MRRKVRSRQLLHGLWLEHGLFGLQQLARTEAKVVLFSVWDPTQGDDPGAVKAEDRVEVLAQGQGVRIRRFGGEGTGAQCMAPFAWKVGETNHFLLQGIVQGQKTAYTAWVWVPQKNCGRRRGHVAGAPV